MAGRLQPARALPRARGPAPRVGGGLGAAGAGHGGRSPPARVHASGWVRGRRRASARPPRPRRNRPALARRFGGRRSGRACSRATCSRIPTGTGSRSSGRSPWAGPLSRAGVSAPAGWRSRPPGCSGRRGLRRPCPPRARRGGTRFAWSAARPCASPVGGSSRGTWPSGEGRCSGWGPLYEPHRLPRARSSAGVCRSSPEATASRSGGGSRFGAHALSRRVARVQKATREAASFAGRAEASRLTSPSAPANGR